MDEFGRGDFGIVWNEAEEVGQTACYLRGRTGGAQMFHVEGAVAFAQATSLGVAEQRHMGESRRLQAEKTIEVYLLGCRKQQVGASHDLGHAHGGIVDNGGKQFEVSCAGVNNLSCKLFNLQGMEVAAAGSADDTILLDASSVQDGIYVLSVDAAGQKLSRKLVIR